MIGIVEEKKCASNRDSEEALIERVRIDSAQGGAIAVFLDKERINVCATPLANPDPNKVIIINTIPVRLKNTFPEGSPFNQEAFYTNARETVDGVNEGGFSSETLVVKEGAFSWVITLAPVNQDSGAMLEEFCEIIVDDGDPGPEG